MNLYQPTITGSLSVSGSVNISGSITIAGGGTISGTASIATTALTASSADNLLVRNTLTAQTLVVQTITSSVDFVTGSTRFGSILGNTHQFTGSVSMTGSLAVVTTGTELQVNATGVNLGNAITDTHNITGSVGISGSLSGVGANFSGNVTAGGSSVDTSGGLYSNIAVNATLYSRYSLLSGGTAKGRFQFDGADVSMISTTTGGKLQLGTIGSNSLEFVTNDSLKMTITTAGNIGVGTATPSAVKPTTTFGWASNLPSRAIEIAPAGSAASGANAGLFLRSSDAANGFDLWADNFFGDGYLDVRGDAGFIFRARTNGTAVERMRINNSGNVGIGTSSPSTKLHINTTATAENVLKITNSTLDLTLGVNTDSGGSFLFENSNNALRFGTNATERMRITSAGNVGIGITPNSWASGTTALQIGTNGTLWNRASDGLLVLGSNSFFNGSADIQITTGTSNRMYFVNGSITFDRAASTAAGSNTPWNNTMTMSANGSIGAPSGTNIYNASDLRLKQNISTITDGLSKINALNPVKFSWIDDFEPSENGKELLGFIAQEVNSIIPEAVESFGGNSIIVNDIEIENPLRVNEKFIIPVLVKAIQELKAEFDEYKTTHP
jgi:hypothetical protein